MHTHKSTHKDILACGQDVVDRVISYENWSNAHSLEPQRSELWQLDMMEKYAIMHGSTVEKKTTTKNGSNNENKWIICAQFFFEYN